MFSPFPVSSAARTIGSERVSNRLLTSLPDQDFARVAAALHPIPATVRLVLQEDGKPIETVFFPDRCVASATTVMDDGGMVEVATVGREGLATIAAVFGAGPAVGETVVQVAGGVLFAMPVAAFHAELDRHGAMRDIVNRYLQAFLFQSMRGTACNALHAVENRCARWLLESCDRVGTAEFGLSHDFLAVMLGVHRPTVSVALAPLQKAGLIHSRRGTIQVLDRLNLERTACECYLAVRNHFEQLGLSPRESVARGQVHD